MEPGLSSLVECELTKSALQPRSSQLQELYHDRRAENQWSDRLTMALFAGAMGPFFALFDAILLPDVFPQLLVVRIVLSFLLLVGIVYQVRRRTSLKLLELESAIIVAVAHGTWFWIGIGSTYVVAESYYLHCGILFIMAANTFFNLSFGLALASSGAMLGTLLLAVARGLPGPDSFAWEITALYTTTLIVTLFVHWKLDRERYLVFLNELRAEARQAEVVAQAATLRLLATTDALTGLPNRRAVDDSLRHHWQDWRERDARFGVILIDVDHFKRFNDGYGHHEGDRCLAMVAEAMKEVTDGRACMLGRFGGEEFIVLTRAKDGVGLLATAEKVRRAVADAAMEHRHRGDATRIVTISAGAALCTELDEDRPEGLVTRADSALYAAKASGRDRVRLFDASVPGALGQEETSSCFFVRSHEHQPQLNALGAPEGLEVRFAVEHLADDFATQAAV